MKPEMSGHFITMVIDRLVAVHLASLNFATLVSTEKKRATNRFHFAKLLTAAAI